MERNEAHFYALGFAHAKRDAGELAVCPAGQVTGALAFAVAFADAQDRLNRHRTDYLPSVDLAFRAWQLSQGQTIYPCRIGRTGSEDWHWTAEVVTP